MLQETLYSTYVKKNANLKHLKFIINISSIQFKDALNL